jgi:hypothetical protein
MQGGRTVAAEAEGYEIRAERWMDRWVVVVRMRLRYEDDGLAWADMLHFQTGHYDWADPHQEAQSLAMQVARRLE